MTLELPKSKETSYGHGPGGVFSAPGVAGAANALQVPRGGMNRKRRKKKMKNETTKETVVTVSNFNQGMGNPITVIVPDIVHEQIIEIPVLVPVGAPEPAEEMSYYENESEPCPSCDTFIELPDDYVTGDWYQCPNCGAFFYVRESDSDFVAWHGYTVERAAEIFGITPPDTAPMALLSPVNDNNDAQAVEYKAVSLAVATLKANYNAKAGETIAGNLARGGDGKFASGGGAPKTGELGTDAASLDEVKRRVAALHAPKGKGGGKKKAAPKGKKAPKGKAPKKTKDEKQKEKDDNRAKNLTKAFGDDGMDEALTNVRDDPTTELNPEYQKKLTDAGLIRTNSKTGLTTLTAAGRSAMRSAENNDAAGMAKAQKIGLAHAKANDTAAAKSDAAKKTAADKKAAAASKHEANKKAVADRKAANAAKRQASAQKRAAALRQRADALETTKQVATASDETGSMAVFKQKNGAWRWITFTSSSFEDGDREVVTQKAIEADVERADLDGDYGPLRWFHVPGMDIGDCDFNMVVDRVLVESGTFRDAFIAQKMAAVAPNLEVSAGFYRPQNEPVDGVYHHFRRFERSLLPRGLASNIVTQLIVKENDMASLKEKMTAFIAVLGGGPEAEEIASRVIGQAQAVTKEAIDAGVTHKAVGDEMAEGSDAEEATETPDEESVEDAFVGDLTIKEFTALVAGILHSTGATNPSPVTKETVVAAVNEALAARPADAITNKAASDLAGLAATVKSLSDQLNRIQTGITELTGDQPRIMRGYVASSSNENVIAVPTLKAGPADDDIDTVAAKAGQVYYGGQS